MHSGPYLRSHVLVALAAASALITVPAFAQSPSGGSAAAESAAPTPIPTLPPLPPLGGAAAVPTTVPQLTPALPATSAPLSTQATAVISPSPAGSVETPSQAPAGLPSSVLLLLGIGVLVLAATLVVVLTVLLKKPVVINVPSRSAAPPPPPLPEGPAPAAWTDGNVVRAGQPPGGALDVLPGRFLVDEGERQTELRIFRTAPGERVETTIGRDAGPPYRHIQLLPETVAGKHAKLVYDRKSYSLINYARANPTRINGEEMEENASRRLVHGDRIEIGGVAMTYQED
jgi:hypothetical protein